MLFKKEGDGRGYYQRFGDEAGIAGFASIFRMFSEDELRHADALRALQEGGPVALPASGTLEGATPILRRIAVQGEAHSRFLGNPGSYWRAMQFEALSARALERLAGEASEGWERELFLAMAADDEVHFTLLEQMQELVEGEAVRTGVRDGR